MKKIIFVGLLFCMSSCFAQDALSRGLNYYFAKRPDLAAKEFEALLQEKFSPEEKQVILYDIATSLLAEGFLNEADHYFDEIDPALIVSQKVIQSYYLNRALCALEIAKRAITLGPQGLSLIDLYNEIRGCLKKAENSVLQLAEPQRGALSQEIQHVQMRLNSAQLEWAVQEKSQSFRIDWFSEYPSSPPHELIAYKLSQNERQLDEVAKEKDVLRKCTLFLRDLFEGRSGLVATAIVEKKKQIVTLQGWLLIQALEELRFLLLLYNAKNDERQIEKALQLIVEAHAYANIFKSQKEQQTLWLSVEKQRTEFLLQLIEEKKCETSSNFQRTFQKALLNKVRAHLLKFSPEDTLKYYKLLCQHENESFAELCFGQKESTASPTFQALFDRIEAKCEALKETGNMVEAEKMSASLKELTAAEKSYPKKEDLIEAWLIFDQEYCLRFLLDAALRSKAQECINFFVFSWNIVKVKCPEKYNRVKASIDRASEELINQAQKSGDFTRYSTACLFSIKYELFYVNGVYPTQLVEQVTFGIEYEKRAIDDLEFLQKNMKDTQSEQLDFLTKILDVLHTTTLDSLMSLEDVALDANQKRELDELQGLFCALYSTLAGVEGEIMAHKKALMFLEKLQQEVQKNESRQSEMHSKFQKQKTDEQTLGQSHLEITTDEALSDLLRMESEDRKAQDERMQIQTEIGKPW